jgi:hypothetical protein
VSAAPVSVATVSAATVGAAAPRVSYDYAVLRVVPRPHTGAWVPVGVVVHARTAEFLALRVRDDVPWVAERLARAPGGAGAVDVELLARYLAACEAVCRGDEEAARVGHAVALAPPSERFHWITAPRSDVLQCSPVHSGVCGDPAWALERLFAEYVGERAA